MDVVKVLEGAASGTAQVIGELPPDRWSSTTPCPEMTVGVIVEHLVDGLQQFADVGAGIDVDPTSQVSLTHAVAATEYDRACDRMLSVWSDPACVERTYAMPWGDTTGHDMVGFIIIEQVAHGWDLATASGQDPGYDDTVVEAALALAHTYDNEAIRVPGMFDPIVEIADDAPTIDRLAAFLGRDPAAS